MNGCMMLYKTSFPGKSNVAQSSHHGYHQRHLIKSRNQKFCRLNTPNLQKNLLKAKFES